MSISPEQLDHLAALAYLKIDPATAPQLAKDLNAIVEFVAQLQDVDTTHVKALMHPLDACQRLRADEAQEHALIQALGQCAPHFKDQLYLVPKVITSER
jgi:aspartyl-tRNA(Asn)/glutamyl-tRNA(Gln) amidotransferase subunit C